MMSVLRYVTGSEDPLGFGTSSNSYMDQSVGYSEVGNIDEDEDLLSLMRTGNVAGIKALVAAGADASVSDEIGRQPLHLAACQNRVDLVNLLMSLFPDVDAQDNLGFTPLHIACTRGLKSMVKCLLDLGANVEATDSEGKTPLHLACCRSMDPSRIPDRVEVLAMLISKKPNLDHRDNSGQAPLHIAAQEGNLAAVQKLLVAGATRSLPDKHDKKPFEIASERGFQGIVRALQQEDTKAQMLKMRQYSDYL